MRRWCAPTQTLQCPLTGSAAGAAIIRMIAVAYDLGYKSRPTRRWCARCSPTQTLRCPLSGSCRCLRKVWASAQAQQACAVFWSVAVGPLPQCGCCEIVALRTPQWLLKCASGGCSRGVRTASCQTAEGDPKSRSPCTASSFLSLDRSVSTYQADKCHYATPG